IYQIEVTANFPRQVSVEAARDNTWDENIRVSGIERERRNGVVLLIDIEVGEIGGKPVLEQIQLDADFVLFAELRRKGGVGSSIIGTHSVCGEVLIITCK